MNYEYYLIHRETKRRAKVQGKTGNTALNADEWKDPINLCFFFRRMAIISELQRMM